MLIVHVYSLVRNYTFVLFDAWLGLIKFKCHLGLIMGKKFVRHSQKLEILWCALCMIVLSVSRIRNLVQSRLNKKGTLLAQVIVKGKDEVGCVWNQEPKCFYTLLPFLCILSLFSSTADKPLHTIGSWSLALQGLYTKSFVTR